jgi:hypothetical protein
LRSWRQLGQRSVVEQLFEVPVNGIRPLSQLFTPIDPSRPQMPFEFLKFRANNIGECCLFLQELSLKCHA